MSVFEKLKELSSKNTVGGKPEFIIAGLGNPGVAYEETRHNAGFITIDLLCRKLGVKCDRAKYKSMYCEAVIGDKKCLILKPMTYMNNSGEAVAEVMNFYKIPSERLIVVYDDISLDPGKLRIRRKGSHGGHNGMKSIIQLTGSDDFPRIKVGIGKKPHPDYDLADWVTSRFTEDEKKNLIQAGEKACDAVELIVGGSIDKAMNLYNS